MRCDRCNKEDIWGGADLKPNKEGKQICAECRKELLSEMMQKFDAVQVVK